MRRPPLRVVGSRSHGNPALDKALQVLGPHELKPAGSSIKLCLVADGSADLYPRLGPTSEWDIAAGQAVVEAAGGQVVRLAGWTGARIQHQGRHPESRIPRLRRPGLLPALAAGLETYLFCDARRSGPRTAAPGVVLPSAKTRPPSTATCSPGCTGPRMLTCLPCWTTCPAAFTSTGVTWIFDECHRGAVLHDQQQLRRFLPARGVAAT